MALERELRAPGTADLFASARLRHTAFAFHDSPDSALAVLADNAPERNAEKDGITRALLVEHQRHESPLWSALLVLAYLPMLSRLSSRIRADVPDPLERDQLVLGAFLEVLATIKTNQSWLCLTLRRRTERMVFRHLRGERQGQRHLYSVDPEELQRYQEHALISGALDGGLWPQTLPEGGVEPMDDDEQAVCAALLIEHAGHVLDPTDLELVMATLVRGERLTRYVQRRYPDLPDVKLRREYQRLKRRHSRAMARLREVFSELWQRQRTGDGELLLAA